MSLGASTLRRRAWLAYFGGPLIAYLLSAPLSSCTILLATIGAVSDAGVPDPGVIPRERIVLLRRDAPIELELRDGSRLAGIYQGVGLIAGGAHRDRYESWRSARPEEEAWPAFGQLVTFRRHGREAREAGRFEGFSIEGVVLEPKSAEKPPREVRYSAFDTLAFDGAVADRRMLLDVLHGSSTPSRTQILVVTGRNVAPRRVPLDNVASVVFRGSRHAARRGMIVGLVVDALVIAAVVAVAASYQGPFESTGGCESSSLGTVPAPADFDLRRGAFVPETAIAATPAGHAPAPPSPVAREASAPVAAR